MNKGGLRISPVIFVFAAILFFIVSVLGIVSLIAHNDEEIFKDDVGTFRSCSELAEYLNKLRSPDYFPLPIAKDRNMISENVDSSSSETDSRNEYSQTNVQVDGIDEADFVKTNGDYMYVLFEGVVTIFDVRDEQNPVRVKDSFVGSGAYQMFLSQDQLIVFSNVYGYLYDYYKSSGYNSSTQIKIYSISDPTELSLQREVAISGDFVTARLVKDSIYLVLTNYIDSFRDLDEESIFESLPRYTDSLGTEEETLVSDCNEITYIGDNPTNYITTFEIPLDTSKDLNGAVTLGTNPYVYMSFDNLYITSVIYTYKNHRPSGRIGILPTPPIIPDEIESTQTEILRISLGTDDLAFEAVGKVPGLLHNQFSMDEYYGTLRVATTENNFWDRDSNIRNSVYILNTEDMKIRGSISDLGLGEEIKSTRFIKERLYLVTFRQIDPFYVVDLANPDAPKVLGELKIPGFSGYLHPYDDNSIIGVGKDGDDFGRLGGVKVSIYDVSDVSNPVVKSEIIFGDETYNSPVIYDHKAFLFDKDKELLVLPIESYLWSGEESFNGFKVITINDEGLSERGEVPFNNHYNYNHRSLYVGNSLITILGDTIKFNDLTTVKLIQEFDLK